MRTVVSALLLYGCATTHARPEVLTVRDPYKLCRIVAFSRCDPHAPAPTFVDADDATATLGLRVVEDGVE